MGKVVGLEDLLRQRQSLIEARSSEVEVVSLASSSSISPSKSPSKTPMRLNDRCGRPQHECQVYGHTQVSAVTGVISVFPLAFVTGSSTGSKACWKSCAGACAPLSTDVPGAHWIYEPSSGANITGLRLCT